ncbi:MAG: galactose oxidase [Prevotellaceae bacterium]|jgi:N-acetylneuraminic acid mutarotase|nr:galactose oxidase [Prevotellaceae bacterium]
MKIRNFCFLLIAFTVLTSCGSDEEEELIGNWTFLGSFDGEARGDATGFVIGDAAYICFGYNGKQNAALKDLWEYNPSNKTWKQKTIVKNSEGKDSITFPGTARYAAVSFSVGGKAYVGLGYDGKTALKDFWEYDPKTDKWTKIEEEFPGVERYYAVGASVGGKGYVGTGYDGGSNLKDFYSFTPGTTPGSGTWATISSYEGSKRSGASVFVIGNYLYMLGGTANDGNPTDMQKYDPSKDTWTKILDLRNTDLTAENDKYDNIPRTYANTFVINNKGYITLGQKTMSLSSTYEYDPETNAWTERTPFSRSTRSYAVSFSLNNRGFIMTGRSGSGTRFDDFFEFHPSDTNDEYDDF